MNIVSGSVLIVLLAVVLCASRRWALLAFLAGVFYLTQGHSVSVAGLSFFPIRLLSLAAALRVVSRSEVNWRALNRLDRTLLLTYNLSALLWILRAQTFAPEQFGSALDPTLCYLGLRGLVRDLDDVRWFLTAFAALLMPFTALVLLERLTGRNAFELVGASSRLMYRDGTARCQGPFRHAILLGSVAASFLPLYIARWRSSVDRLSATFGAGLCVANVLLTNSGGPATSAAVAVLGWALWPLRRRMSVVRRATLGVLLLLMVFMKAPIWYLPFKVSAVVGGGGYHRGLLMERAWQHLGQWWLAGMDIRDTASWFPYLLETVGGADVTNQYLAFGLRAGLGPMLLFIAAICIAYSRLGRALVILRSRPISGRDDELLLWGLGVTIMVHVVSWLGVSYFDQSWVVWLFHAAAVSAATEAVTASAASEVRPAQRSVRRSIPGTSLARPSRLPRPQRLSASGIGQ